MRPDPDTAAAADVMFTYFGVVSMTTAEVAGIDVKVGRCETLVDALETSWRLSAAAAVVVMETTGENDAGDDDETGIEVSVTRALAVDVASCEVAADDVEDTVVVGDTVVVSTIRLLVSMVVNRSVVVVTDTVVVLSLVGALLEVLGGSRSRVVVACNVVAGGVVAGYTMYFL